MKDHIYLNVTFIECHISATRLHFISEMCLARKGNPCMEKGQDHFGYNFTTRSLTPCLLQPVLQHVGLRLLLSVNRRIKLANPLSRGASEEYPSHMRVCKDQGSSGDVLLAEVSAA